MMLVNGKGRSCGYHVFTHEAKRRKTAGCSFVALVMEMRPVRFVSAPRVSEWTKLWLCGLTFSREKLLLNFHSRRTAKTAESV